MKAAFLPVLTVRHPGAWEIVRCHCSGDPLRNLAMAWVLTLPASMIWSGFLFWGFRNIF